MGHFELISFTTAEELAGAAASSWLDGVAAAKGPFCVALPGGRIAGKFFSAATERARARSQSLGQVHFFWSDERCVPPSDPESNFRLARERLLDPLEIPAAQIHRLRGEADPEEAAREAESEMRRIVPCDASRQPMLDLALLGMGEDGHVASLFPGESEALLQNPAVFRAIIGPKPPLGRITIGYAALAAARQVWVLVSGAGKETALRESFSLGGRTPLARLLKMRHETAIFSGVRSA
jgi:6-phosphogluconolactonase